MAPTTLRSVERPARLRISARASTPPAAANSWPTTLASFRRRPCSMSRMTSGLVSLIVAMRRATSACSSGESSASTRAARVECTLATTSAMVCGDSSLRKAWTCSGGVRRRNSKGRVSGLVVTSPMISSARSAPTSCDEHLAGELGAAHAAAEHVVAGEALLDLAHDGGAGLRAHAPQGGHLGRQRLDLALAEVLEDVGGALGAEADEQDGGLLAAAQAGGAASTGTGAAARVALGALAVERGLLAHSGSSLIQARSCWATRSGCSCTRLSTVERPAPAEAARRRRPAPGRGARGALELGQRARALDLGQPRRHRQGLLLATAQGAGHEEEEEDARQADARRTSAGRRRRAARAGRPGRGRPWAWRRRPCSGSWCRRAWG